VSMQPASPGGAVERSAEGTLSDVINSILDKGLVIDVYARVSLVGIEVLRADVRVVVASVDTYLRFAEAANRLELGAAEPHGLPEFVENLEESGSEKKTKGALNAAAEKVSEIFEPGEEEEEREREPVARDEEGRRRRRSERRASHDRD
jgi:hypothetical protein